MINFNNEYKSFILEKINDYDHQFYLKNKITKEYTFKGYVNRKIILKGELLNIKIRKYYDLKQHKTYYPIYEYLDIDKYQRYDNTTKNEVVKKVLLYNNSYKSAGYINDKISMSKSTVFKCINKISNNNCQYKISNFVPKKDKIFICIDDTFRKLKVKNKATKFRFRIINIYQNKINNKFENQIKVCMIFKTNTYVSTINKTTKLIKSILEKYYKYLDLKQKLIVCGDGAKYINTISNQLKSIQILDKFHCFQNVFKVYNYKNINRNLSKEDAIKFNIWKKESYTKIVKYLQNKQFDLVYKIIDNSKLIFKEIVKIIELIRLKKYIKFHQKHIQNWDLYEFNTTYTETYIQSVIKSRFGNNGKTFCYDIFKKILSINALVF